jgi:hypothetical protein
MLLGPTFFLGKLDEESDAVGRRVDNYSLTQHTQSYVRHTWRLDGSLFNSINVGERVERLRECVSVQIGPPIDQGNFYVIRLE